MVGSRRASSASASSVAPSSGCDIASSSADTAEGVQHQQAARAGASEPRQTLDVRAQQRVDLGQRPRQHRRHLAGERLSGAHRVAVADQHQVRERPQLAPRGQRIAARAHPGVCLRLRLQLGIGQIQDRQIERLVGEPCQPFGHGLDLEDEALAGQRPDDARALDAVSERDEETLLPTARGIPEDLQRLARAICVYHRAAQLYLETPPVTSNEEGARGAQTGFAGRSSSREGLGTERYIAAKLRCREVAAWATLRGFPVRSSGFARKLSMSMQ